MTLGAGMPMGPMALLDFIGLDVCPGDRRGDRRSTCPARLAALVEEGALGRKSRHGFYSYD